MLCFFSSFWKKRERKIVVGAVGVVFSGRRRGDVDFFFAMTPFPVCCMRI